MAEIFSRYYDKDVRMHGFDNGTATRVKRDNWGQLTRFFKKVRPAYARSVAKFRRHTLWRTREIGDMGLGAWI